MEAILRLGVLYWAIGASLSQFIIVGLLWHSRQRSRAKARSAPPLSNYPPLSIVTSLKGPTPGAAEAVRSLLAQDYPGEIELVFALSDEKEPLYAEIRAVVAAFGGPRAEKVKWVYPVDTKALNPRTAKIAKAYEHAGAPWIFMTCVDTSFVPDFLRSAMMLARGDPNHYVTSFPVIQGMGTFAAKLEGVGLNVEVSQFFLISTLSANSACAYGGAFLFSRALIEKVGGFKPFLPLLTDDITLAKAFTQAGGHCLLTAQLARVQQERHSFAQYWSRQVRWRMIGRYFLPSLYWLAPLSWAHLGAFLGALVWKEPIFWWALAGVHGSRWVAALGTQWLLESKIKDIWCSWVIPFYDWLAIPAFFASAFKRSVVWADIEMHLDSRGSVSGTRNLE